VIAYGLPIAATLFIWWFSTGAILFLDGLPKHTFRWSMLAATLVAVGAFYGLSTTSNDTSIAGIYTAFACSMLVWAWNEMAFLMGYITGPRRTECPPEAKGFQRFLFATQSIIYHELMIVLSGVMIGLITWGGSNAIGLWTFVVLWIMRLSTKLNIFLGVPNTTIDFLPDHLGYLKSYFAIKPMNLLFPISVSVSTIVTTLLIGALLSSEPNTGSTTGLVLLSTLMALAVLEHWFLVIPLPFGDLWSWGLSSRHGSEGASQNHGPIRTQLHERNAPIMDLPSVTWSAKDI
jgi:putative photosynthetic complex assembly protein 2